LLDTILAVVVIGMAVTAVMSVFIVTSQHSVDPMMRQQAQFIAEAYLEEILLQKFYDPDTDNVCPAPEGARDLYDNVCDYRNISNQAPANQLNQAISGLGAYQVTVAVTRDNSVSLNGLTNDTAAGVYRVLRVDVTVTGPNNAAATMTGYRTNFNCNAAGDAGCKAL
jgi:MSHA pilin protein MshD